VTEFTCHSKERMMGMGGKGHTYKAARTRGEQRERGIRSRDSDKETQGCRARPGASTKSTGAEKHRLSL
jgi:hypothetical protein